MTRKAIHNLSAGLIACAVALTSATAHAQSATPHQLEEDDEGPRFEQSRAAMTGTFFCAQSSIDAQRAGDRGGV